MVIPQTPAEKVLKVMTISLLVEQLLKCQRHGRLIREDVVKHTTLVPTHGVEVVLIEKVHSTCG